MRRLVAHGRRGMRSAVRLGLVLLTACLSPAMSAAQSPPSLVIEAPPELAAARSRLASFDRAPLAGIVRTVGLAEPGAPIQVVLADESSTVARERWTAPALSPPTLPGRKASPKRRLS